MKEGMKTNAKEDVLLTKSGPAEKPVTAGVSAAEFSVKKILVPVDFSDCSKKALQYAVPFAKKFGAELELLHVVEPYPPIPEMGPVEMETLQDAKTSLLALCRTISDLKTHGTLRTGTPANEIVVCARELGIDLIVMSTHGHTGLTRMFLGSTAEKVVRHAPCPVLSLHESERELPAFS
jgi:nucleotide-binding universal stress UspA family protein